MEHITIGLLGAFEEIEKKVMDNLRANDNNAAFAVKNAWNPISQATLLYPYSSLGAGEIVEYIQKYDDKYSIVRNESGAVILVPHEHIRVSIRAR